VTDSSSFSLNTIDLQIIDCALTEDLGFPYQDITTNLLFREITNQREAHIVSKHKGPIVICGLPIVNAVLAKISKDCQIKTQYDDGHKLPPGETLLVLSGPPSVLLMVERIMLNYLQRLSAIATTTATFVEAIKHTNASLLDTRKTLPGFRHLEKYAVYCGGGVNHRMGLYDAVMIKDTHIDFIGGLSKALAMLPDDILKTHPVIVEIRNQHELDIVLETGRQKVSRVLFDNMSLALMRQCVTKCQGIFATEASGNIQLNNVVAVAECGVNFISIGQITHSASHVDLSMRCEI
jgi:nicotinate-nucleotide pyrophosphorylase (carboxylating)